MNNDPISKSLRADYIYIFAPFLLLIIIKTYFGDYSAIIKSADWSLAACLIIGQSQSKVIRASLISERNVKDAGVYYFIAKRFLLIVVALSFYVLMLLKPSTYLGVLQIIVFFIASFLHFSDGRVALKLMQK